MSVDQGSSAQRQGLDWLNISLWTAQIVLAAIYGLAGVMKTFMPVAELATQMSWAAQSPEWLIRFIGIAELAGALGLIFPALTRILPLLTPLAALGLSVIQVLAIGTHAGLGELVQFLPVNGALLALSLFVLWGRFRPRAISAR